MINSLPDFPEPIEKRFGHFHFGIGFERTGTPARFRKRPRRAARAVRWIMLDSAIVVTQILKPLG
jgi:hypothetical protein